MSDVEALIDWLLGYDDFPERQEGDGAYWWRRELRARAEALGWRDPKDRAVALLPAPAPAEGEIGELVKTVGNIADFIEQLPNDVWDRDRCQGFILGLEQTASALSRLERERDEARAETVALQASLTARAKLLIGVREDFINIRDDLEDEGDRVYFGSTNDADDFRERVEALDEWVWDDIIADSRKRDLLAELADLRARAEAAEKDAATMRRTLDAAHTLATCAPELNMGNYDEDQVYDLNNAMIELFKVLDAEAKEWANRPGKQGGGDV